MRYLLSFILLILLSTEIVFAQSETFNIRVSGPLDVTPPSTPTLLSVLPIAQTQIDINWSAATDDFIVSGYSVLRDGTAIATTTLLSYSDTGLLASTTYSYTVRAFDLSLNYSSTSNSLATTTFEIPPTPTSTPTSTISNNSRTEGTVARVVIDELRVEEGVSTTSIYANTARSSRLEVRWGRTASYELGYTVSGVYSVDHAILITDLEPGTKYEYEIIGYTPHGFESVVHTGSFVTKSNVQPISPVNISHFLAVRDGDSVDLSWQIPKNNPVSHVRVVRSHLSFPEHPQDGAIVYQGLGSAVRDTDILTKYSPVYYTAFVYDIYGNVSSGAVAIVYAESTKNRVGVEPGNDKEVPVVINEATSSVRTERVTVGMKMPQASEIVITQNNQKYSLFDTDFVLDSEQVFSIAITSSAVAGNLKSIIATFIDPTDNRKTYAFLLRINRDQTAYEATVAALNVVGRSQVTVEIYDYEAFVVATYKTPFKFTNLSKVEDGTVVFPDAVYKISDLILPAIIFFLTIFLIFLLVYRLRGEDKR